MSESDEQTIDITPICDKLERGEKLTADEQEILDDVDFGNMLGINMVVADEPNPDHDCWKCGDRHLKTCSRMAAIIMMSCTFVISYAFLSLRNSENVILTAAIAVVLLFLAFLVVASLARYITIGYVINFRRKQGLAGSEKQC
jgi:hypothetical protein